MTVRIFEWRPQYAVGVPSIDSQHRQLFQLADELHAALLAGGAKPRLAEMLARLHQYVRFHFADEERLMRSIGYPDYAAQMREHQELRDRMAAFEQKYEAGETAITIRLMEFVAAWLARHTSTEDRRIGAYLERSGVSLLF